MGQLKVAIYSGNIPSETFIERLVAGLANNGVKVLLFGIQRKKIEYHENVRLFTYSNSLEKFIFRWKYSILLSIFKPKEKKKLCKIIASKPANHIQYKLKFYPVLYHQPDIFHLQWAIGIEDWIWVQEFGIKFILSLLGTHINISPVADKNLARVYETLFPKVDAFHAVSKAISKEAKKYNANQNKTRVIYSGLNLEKMFFQPINNADSLLRLISVGRSHWVKGYMDAMDACLILKNNGLNFIYEIIGVENDEELLFQRRQLGLEKEVLFKSNLPFDKIISEIQSATFLILPSLEEGIANVVLEAMALGTLVISSDCGGMSEVIKNGINGFLVPIRNPEAMAAKIMEASRLTDAEHQTILGNARIKIEAQHSIDLMVNDMQKLYSTVYA